MACVAHLSLSGLRPIIQRREGFFKTVLSDVPLHRSLLRRSALRNFRWLQRALSDRRRSFSGTRFRSNPCFPEEKSFTALPIIATDIV